MEASTIKTINVIKIKIDRETEELLNAMREKEHCFEWYTDHVDGEGKVLIIEELDG
jgi:hypothetical protein